MPRDMFGDVVDPSIKVGSQAVVHGAAVDPGARGALRRGHHHSADGDRRAADAAVDDGVRGAAAAAATAAAAPATGRGAAEGGADAGDQSERGADRGAEGNQARAPAPATGVSEGVPGGVEGGIPGGDDRRRRRRSARAPPPPPPPPSAPVRVGGDIKAPTKTQERQADLPADRAVRARAGHRHHRSDHRPDGRVKDAKVLRSIPLLDQAALDAVKQWQFTPTLLNGVPVPVIMTVTVNFTLQ